MMDSTKKKGIFNSKIFDSRVRSNNVQKSERWLGFLLGPAGVMIMYTTLSGTYLNVFYTDVLKVSSLWGGMFLTIMPIASKIFDAIANMIMGSIIDHTHSRRGKARPWLLISGPAMAISGILLYMVPQASTTVKMWWIIISYNLFFAFASTMYTMSHTLMVPLSTRNIKQRNGLALLSNAGSSIIPGILGSIAFPMVVLPWLSVNEGHWITVMSILSIVAIPAVMLEYYFTKERITEETFDLEVDVKGPTLKQQLKACFTSKYWIIIMAVTFIFQMYNNIQNTSLIYYCNWVLGTYNDGKTQVLVSAVGQAPLGVGIFLLWRLCKKFSKRNIMIGCFAMAAIGSAICLAAPTSMIIVLIGLIIKSFGMLPIYLITAMLAEVLDHVEWKNGFRCDGISASIYSVIFTVSAGLSVGLFNLGLDKFGYIAPSAGGKWVAQNVNIQRFLTIGYSGVPMVAFLLIIILMIFFKIEKELPTMQFDITARNKVVAQAKGIVWISPEEKERMEQEEQDKVAEVERIEELKALCVKKHLKFEEEETKYQAKLAIKAAKRNKKK